MASKQTTAPALPHSEPENALAAWAADQAWREVTHLPRDNPAICAVAYLAVLLYPDEVDKRDRYVDAFRDYARRVTQRGGEKLKPYEISRVLIGTRATARLEKRLTAGRMAARIALARRTNGTAIEVDGPLGVREAVSNKALNRIAVTLRRTPSQPRKPIRPKYIDLHVLNRVWKPSKPVLHMAHALAVQWDRDSRMNAKRLLLEPDWAPAMIERLPGYALSLVHENVAQPSELILLDLS